MIFEDKYLKNFVTEEMSEKDNTRTFLAVYLLILVFFVSMIVLHHDVVLPVDKSGGELDIPSTVTAQERFVIKTSYQSLLLQIVTTHGMSSNLEIIKEDKIYNHMLEIGKLNLQWSDIFSPQSVRSHHILQNMIQDIAISYKKFPIYPLNIHIYVNHKNSPQIASLLMEFIDAGIDINKLTFVIDENAINDVQIRFLLYYGSDILK